MILHQEEITITITIVIAIQRKEKEEDGKKPVANFQIAEGTCLYLEGIAPQDVDRESMKELFGKHGSVVYVDFQRGDVSACTNGNKRGNN